ncbi:CRAL-TRIO domain-containing protein [Gilbertella persicaria]|uniref:CRAL-TRIO domain-containing protein n=1 Tax=Gilbertella persicaria TaxID=101096 RepID=UPI00221EB536|nr:CRAL-TRIO domain-containing protein [Gilbertella persicaria]KAI8062344.1 CRAL-TRIO domain-containing protein [Gilbertella persicaria]
MSENKFVSKFTVTEAVAVQQLKDALPDILTEAFGSSDVYTLWTVLLDKSSEDDRIKVVLVKFLRARNLDISAAKTMLINTLKWRKEFSADTLLEETFDEQAFNDSIGFLYKHDKEKRPVTYNFYGDLNQETVFGDVNKFIRWRVQLMEKGIRDIDFVNTDTMVQVHDYKGASMFGRTANAKEATNTIIKLMQDNYPEFLSSKIFVNVPKWGSIVFKLIRPLLSEATVKKFVICSNDELSTTLLHHFNKEDLPPVYAKQV